MIVNPDKLQAIILDRKKPNLKNIIIKIPIKSFLSVELLGTHLDDQSNFNLHITNSGSSAANQLNVLIRL